MVGSVASLGAVAVVVVVVVAAVVVVVVVGDVVVYSVGVRGLCGGRVADRAVVVGSQPLSSTFMIVSTQAKKN